MNKLMKAAVGGLISSAMTLAPAGAREPDPQLGTYLIWKFGAQDARLAGDRFHYGLRLDYDAYSAQTRGLPPLLRVNVSPTGLDTYLNGSSLRGMALRMQQVEGVQLGTILTAAGAVAVGVGTVVLVTEEATKDDPAPTNSGNSSSGSGSGSSGSSSGGSSSGSGSSSGGSTSGSGSSGSGSSSGSGTGIPLGGTGYNGRQTAPELDQSEMRGISPEYQQWLDGGSGHMGDLGR